MIGRSENYCLLEVEEVVNEEGMLEHKQVLCIYSASQNCNGSCKKTLQHPFVFKKLCIHILYHNSIVLFIEYLELFLHNINTYFNFYNYVLFQTHPLGNPKKLHSPTDLYILNISNLFQQLPFNYSPQEILASAIAQFCLGLEGPKLLISKVRE